VGVLPDDLSRVTEDSARGGFFLFSGSALATVIMAVAAIIVGRLLGPDLYGQYNLVVTVARAPDPSQLSFTRMNVLFCSASLAYVGILHVNCVLDLCKCEVEKVSCDIDNCSS
jgi:hypothetical protein